MRFDRESEYTLGNYVYKLLKDNKISHIIDLCERLEDDEFRLEFIEILEEENNV